MDKADVVHHSVTERYDQFALAAVFDRVMDGVPPIGNDADLRRVFALCNSLLQQFVEISGVTSSKVLSGTNDDTVECIGGDLAKFADVIVAAVAGSVQNDGAIFVW